MMTYAECLTFLYEQLPMFQREGAAAMKKDLTNIISLCALLGHPQDKFKSIHIAGTNGKGSVSHMISAMGQAAGYRMGLYTSPHYLDFRERIKIDGTPLSERFVIDFVERVKPVIPTLRPSFFEITVAMAFQYFAEKEVDFGVIETGLGGRLDSTSIVTPVLSVITNIGLDHQEFLGDTLPAIAYEKAGIIKEGVPVLIGERQSETLSVFKEVADDRHATLYIADQFVCGKWDGQGDFSTRKMDLVWNLAMDMPSGLDTPLVGHYQLANAITALSAIEILRRKGYLVIERAMIERAFRDIRSLTGILGRWQVLDRGPLVIGDSAHNAAGLKEVLSQILALPSPVKVVMGLVRDKNHPDILALLPTHFEYFWCAADLPRSLAADKLAQMAADYGLKGESYPSVVEAHRAACKSAGPEGAVFVGGSIFVVAEVLGLYMTDT